MSATKVRTSLASNITLNASTSSYTSSLIPLNTGYGAQLNFTLTNGTGPTLPAQVQINVANDTVPTLLANFGGPFVAGTATSTSYQWSVEIPIGVESLQIVAGSNTAQAVTLNCDISQVTGI
jgi:hypothetical protein